MIQAGRRRRSSSTEQDMLPRPRQSISRNSGRILMRKRMALASRPCALLLWDHGATVPGEIEGIWPEVHRTYPSLDESCKAHHRHQDCYTSHQFCRGTLHAFPETSTRFPSQLLLMERSQQGTPFIPICDPNLIQFSYSQLESWSSSVGALSAVALDTA